MTSVDSARNFDDSRCLRILWVLEDKARFDIFCDMFTTEALMREFLCRNDFHQELTTLRRVSLDNGRVMVRCQVLDNDVFDGEEIRFDQAHSLSVDGFDVVFIRVDPFGTELFRHSLILLGMAEESTDIVFVNSPLTMCARGSKIFNQRFSDRMVPSVVVGNDTELERVLQSAPDIHWVAKPLDRASGLDVVRFHPQQDDYRVTVRRMLRKYGYILVQHYIPGVESEGEIRHLVFAGEIIAAWCKRPAPGEFKANLDRGATIEPVPGPPFKAEAEAVVQRMSRIAPEILFYSADFIGPWLNELNIENIGGLPSADALYSKCHASIIASRLNAITASRRWAKI